MKNPRGYFLSGLFLIATLLFAMGSIQGNPIMAKYHVQMEYANPPPQQIVIAIIETPVFLVTNEPVIDVQIARGVSVPLKGLIVSATTNVNYINQITGCMDRFCIICESNLLSATEDNTNTELLAVNAQMLIRGVNTRLDIGESELGIS